jgi:hypothetical protein
MRARERLKGKPEGGGGEADGRGSVIGGGGGGGCGEEGSGRVRLRAAHVQHDKEGGQRAAREGCRRFLRVVWSESVLRGSRSLEKSASLDET